MDQLQQRLNYLHEVLRGNSYYQLGTHFVSANSKLYYEVWSVVGKEKGVRIFVNEFENYLKVSVEVNEAELNDILKGGAA